MNETTLEIAQQLLATKEFSYKDINPSEKGIFLAALVENGKVAKEGTNHHSNIPKGTLISEWYLRHKLGLSGAIKHDLYTSLELWKLDDKRYQIIYYKTFGLGNYVETKSEFYDDKDSAQARLDEESRRLETELSRLER